MTSAPAGRELRHELWDEFIRATNAIRSVSPVAAAWIGGSFLSSRSNPSDIDVVYWLRAEDYDRVQDDSLKKRLNIFRGEQQLFRKNIRVDSYVMDWRPRSSAKPVGVLEQEPLAHRGYWDDWFQRQKTESWNGVGSDPLPRRGYVEVILDGFEA